MPAESAVPGVAYAQDHGIHKMAPLEGINHDQTCA
jgi:hypothetical protein